MLRLVELFIQAANLVEAEGRAFKRGVMRVLVACVFLAAGLALLFSAFAAFIAGIYLVLTPATGPIGAMFIAGAIALLLAVVLLLIARLSTW